ncbi:hypothetical protein BJ742DRAFT_11919 [Cladochytrium replicatum]|nr:hypothetical protein BJ742DRAFT_11919 [Cladochytrium replicatum]
MGKKPYRKTNDRSFEVESGMAGVLAMCHLKKETRAQIELKSLFEEYAEKFYGEEQSLAKPRKGRGVNDNANADGSETPDGVLKDDLVEEDSEDGEQSLEDAFKAEMQMLRGNDGASKPKDRSELDKKERIKAPRRFWGRAVGAQCNVFIQMPPSIDPPSFIHRLLTELAAEGKKKTRYITRLVPISNISHASIPAITKMAKVVLEPEFGVIDPVSVDGSDSTASPNATLRAPRSYKIELRTRHNDKLKSEEIIDGIAALVPKHHRVDLKHPELCVMVEVIKSVCGISVVEDYYKFKKYNIEAMFEPTKAQNPSGLPKHSEESVEDDQLSDSDQKTHSKRKAESEDKAGVSSDVNDVIDRGKKQKKE